jgi:hypothetical protein
VPPDPEPPLYTADELEARVPLGAQAHALALDEAGGSALISHLGRIARLVPLTQRDLVNSGYLEFAPPNSADDQMRERIGLRARFPEGEWEWLQRRKAVA